MSAVSTCCQSAECWAAAVAAFEIVRHLRVCLDQLHGWKIYRSRPEGKGNRMKQVKRQNFLISLSPVSAQPRISLNTRLATYQASKQWRDALKAVVTSDACGVLATSFSDGLQFASEEVRQCETFSQRLLDNSVSLKPLNLYRSSGCNTIASACEKASAWQSATSIVAGVSSRIHVPSNPLPCLQWAVART